MRHERSPATAAENAGFCLDRPAQYKGTKAVRFIEALPKSPIGKILKPDLRARAG